MKILIISYDIDLLGGSGISIKILSNFLKSIGNEIWILYKWNIPKIQKWKPDAIISQHWATKDASQLAYQLNIPFVLYVHGPNQYEHWFETKYKNMRCDLIIFNTVEQYRLAKDKIGNTLFTIINPPVIKEKCIYKGNNKNKIYITMIGDEMLKGWDIFIKVARINKDKQFLWVTNNNNQQILPYNLTIMRKVLDVKKIYGITKILLIPSQNESYCRVALEAFYNEIPVIATDLPGIRDATSNMACYIKDRESIIEWSNKINDVQKNYEKYKTLIKKCPPKNTVKQMIGFNSILRHIVNNS